MTFKHGLKKLFVPTLLLVFLVVPMLYFDTIARGFGSGIIEKIILLLKYVLGVFVWLSLAWFLVRVFDLFLWEWALAHKLKITIPKILRDLIAGIIFLIAIAGIISGIFKIPVTGLLATTGAISIVIGLALQSLISDVFSGIVINIEKPFKIGDFIELDNGFIGKVVDINWRTTSVYATARTMSVVPNGKISQMIVKNYNRSHTPELGFWMNFEFHLGCEVPVERALRIITAAAQSLDKNAEAVTTGIDEIGVKYKVYFLVWNYAKAYLIKNDYINTVFTHLNKAGITPAYPKRDMFIEAMPARVLDEKKDLKTLLSRIDIFEPLSEDEINFLISTIKRSAVLAETIVVRAEDKGDSAFIVLEGLLHVFIKIPGRDKEIQVGHIISGQFFGEFSLLTGEKRSATVATVTDCVLYEIRKSDFASLLDANPRLLDSLSHLLAERQLLNEESVRKLNESEKEQKKESLANQFFNKIRGFFTHEQRVL